MRNRNRRTDLRKRTSLAIERFLLCALLLTAGACKAPVVFSPEQVYRDSWLKLRQGDLAGANAEADSALRHFSTPNTDWYWRFTALKAEILVRQGFMQESLALLKPDLPSSLAASDVAVWRKLTQGMASAYLVRFGEAENFLHEAKALAEAHHPELLGEVALRKGTLASLQGDAKSAESAYRDALRMAREQKNSFLEVSALGNMGLVSTQQEQYDEAIEWNDQALPLSRSVGAKDLESYILGNLGWGYFEIGDYEKALEFLEQAESSSRAAGYVAAEVDWLIEIGGVEYYLHDYAGSERESQTALELARKLDEKAEIKDCLDNLSSVALRRKQFDLAERYISEALAVSRASKDRSGELASMLIQGRLESDRHNYRQAEELLQTVVQDPAAGASLRWEAQARLAGVYADANLTAKAEQEYRQSIGTIEKARTSIKDEELRAPFLSNAIEFYDDYIAFLIAHQRIRDALQVAELSRARTLAEGLKTGSNAISLTASRFNPEQIARRSNAVLLFYWMGQEHSYLWIITPRTVNCMPLPSEVEINAAIKSYRDAILAGRDVLENANPEGQKLYSILVEPAKKLIPQGSRVILFPDSSLYGLNFETLLVPEPTPHFWIDDVTLTTASSLTLLAAATTQPVPKEARLLLIGDAAQSTPEFPALRQAAAEIGRVEQYFPPSRREVLTGPKATRTAFLASEPGKFAYVHFVTHGTASRAHPLDSAVILSPEGESSKLYARDIVKQRLAAYLVTISACNGSGIRAYSGEGLVGLSWAFLRAGAHNVIAALWDVNDTSTPQLMDKLYEELARGRDPATALRAAKLSLLHSDSVYKKPFYWAPFQLYAGS